MNGTRHSEHEPPDFLDHVKVSQSQPLIADLTLAWAQYDLIIPMRHGGVLTVLIHTEICMFCGSSLSIALLSSLFHWNGNSQDMSTVKLKCRCMGLAQ